MGEARRRKLAGYVPEQRPQKENKTRKVLVTSRGISSMALAMALMAGYPQLPEEIRRRGKRA